LSDLIFVKFHKGFVEKMMKIEWCRIVEGMCSESGSLIADLMKDGL